jgi:hypothetical protein
MERLVPIAEDLVEELYVKRTGIDDSISHEEQERSMWQPDAGLKWKAGD